MLRRGEEVGKIAEATERIISHISIIITSQKSEEYEGWDREKNTPLLTPSHSIPSPL